MKFKANKKKIIVSKTAVLWFLILICYIESPYLARFQVIDIFYKLGKIVSIGFILFNLKKVRFNFFVSIIILLEGSLWISTLRTGNAIATATNQIFSAIAFVVILDIMLKENARKCIYVLYLIFSLLIYINVLSMILFPNGLYTVSGIVGTKKFYFLGQQNSMGLYSTIAIMLGELRLKIEKDKKYKLSRLILLEVVSLFYIIRVWSVISFFSVGAIIVLNTYNRMSKNGWHFSLVWSLILNAFIFVTFVVGQNLEIFTTFFEKYLHREITLSGRTDIWAVAFKTFLQEPIWGVGLGQGKEMFGFATTHNRYLNTMFTGGLIGTVLFVVLLIWTCLKLKDSKESISKIFIVYFTVLFVIIQGETFEDILFYLMFVLVNNITNLRKNKNDLICLIDKNKS